jgi:hypothetical protein
LTVAEAGNDPAVIVKLVAMPQIVVSGMDRSAI